MGVTSQRLWYTTAVKLARLYLDDEQFRHMSELSQLLSQMQSTCKCPDGVTDDIMGKGSQLLDLYALEIELISKKTKQKETVSRLKEILAKCNQASSAVSNPRSMAIIREYAGKIFMSESRYDDAYNELFEAFKTNSDAGNIRARTVLKYVVLANMVGLSTINPFDSREAKAYLDDPEITVMLKLRRAYENRDISAIEELIPVFTSFADSFMKSYVDALLYTIKLQLIETLSQAYLSVSLDKLAKRVNVPVWTVMRMVLRLIQDGRVKGRIGDGVLVMEKEKEVDVRDALGDVMSWYRGVINEVHNGWKEGKVK